MSEEDLTRLKDTFGHVVRPRAITVTGILWVFLGVSWLFLGTLGLFSALWLTSKLSEVAVEAGRELDGLPLVFWWYPAGALLLGGAGLYYARLALRLEERGRVGLRRVNFGAVLLFGLFILNWMNEVTTSYSAWGTQRPASATQVGMALQGLLVGVLLVVPFLYAAKKLNSDEVRYAMKTLPF